MNADTTTARAVGAMFLAATTSYVAANQLIEPALASPAPSNRIHVVVGALLVLIDGIAVVGIGVAMFSILKRWNKRVALGYFALRVIEAALLLVGVLGPLSVVSAARDSSARALDVTSLALLGVLAGKFNYWAYQMAMVTVGVGGLMMCGLLLRSKLVPRGISILGLVGYPLLTMGAALDMVGLADTLHGSGMLFLAPGGLFELVLPLWLIARGFDFSRPLRTTWASA